MRVTLSCLLLAGIWCSPALAQPANDTCLTATMVPPGPGALVVGFNSQGAGTEPGFEPIPGANPCTGWFIDPIAADVWFEYTATDVQTTFSTCGSSYDTKLEIYDGCPQSDLNLIACNDEGSCLPQSDLVTTTTPGTNYLVRVGGWLGDPGGSAGPGTLTIEPFTPLPNDDCSTPALVTPGVPLSWDNTSATTDSPDFGAIAGSCATWLSNIPDQIHGDLWYRFTAPVGSTLMNISTCGPLGPNGLDDTKLAVYDSLTCPASAGNVIACDDDACGNLLSDLTMNVTPGLTYLVQLGSWSTVVRGEGTLTLTPLADPVANLACAVGPGPNDFSIDFDWPASAVVGDIAEISSDEPGVTNPVATITNTGAASGNYAATLDPANQGMPLSVNFDIVITTLSGLMSPTESCALNFASIPGDECGTATVLPMGDQIVPFDLTSATNSAEGSPTTCSQPTDFNDDIWYLWTADSTFVQITITSATPADDDVIAIYDTCADATAVNPIACNDGGADAQITAPVVPSNTYLIRVANDDATAGPGTMEIAAFTPIAGDTCAAAISLGGGTVTTQFDNTNALDNGPDFAAVNAQCATWLANAPDEIFGDIYYTYTPDPGVTEIRVSTCGALGPNGLTDTKLAVYDSTACPPDPTTSLVGCDDDGCGNLLSELTVNVTPGISYLVQVGSWSTVTRGEGTLTIGPNCNDVSGFVANFDCVTQTTTLSWTENDAYTALSLTANGTPTTTQPTAVGTGNMNTTMDSPPLGTTVTYELTATCANGGTTVVEASVNTAVPGAADNLIIDLELADNIASGVALETALLANSVTVQRITDDANPCLTDLIDTATNIWVMLGTFPQDFELSVALGDALANAVQNGGSNVYLEGGDHWVFDPASNFDLSDGIDSSMVNDGDDYVDRLIASNATSGMLDLTATFPTALTYTQPSAGNDWTDELVLAAPGTGDANITSSEAIWRNDPGPNPAEPNTIVGVAVISTSGQRVICCSWEFGGLAGATPTATADLAGLYLNFFLGNPNPVGEFQRGDCNTDGSKNIADPVRLLNFLFPSMPNTLKCDDACDANDDGSMNIADAVAMLNVLFPSGPPVPWLAPDLCGLDPTMDGLDCLDYTDAGGGALCP